MLDNLSKRKKKVVIIGGSIVLAFVFLIASMEFTSRPKFCITCHYMQPFYDSWKSSSHKDVTCGACHFEPGIKSIIDTKTVGLVHLVTYVTKVYKKMKPMAEISDASCLREGCHETRLLSGKEKFGRTYFDHKPHLSEMRRGKKLRCTSCHSQIVQGAHMTVTETSCFLCHFKSAEGDPLLHDCLYCHDAPVSSEKGEAVTYNHANVLEQGIECERCHSTMIIGDGNVPKEYCFTCHMEPERLEHLSDGDYLHKIHITERKIDCERCHTPIQHKMPEKESLHLLDCTGCHIKPHMAQINLFRGTSGFEVHSIPNPKFIRSITCKGCHVIHEEHNRKSIKEEIFVASEKSCENCHGKGFSKLLAQWKKVSQKKLDQIQIDYRNARSAILNAKSRNRSKALELVKEAQYNIDLVDVGKSVHNIQFADELLRGAYKLLGEGLKQVGAKVTLKPYPETSKLVPTECNSCHFGIEEVSHPIRGMSFSHKIHVVQQEKKCVECHSNEKRHGELIMTRHKCAACHHSENTENCEHCHTTQKSIYDGTMKMDNFEFEPDAMFEAELECSGCHIYGELNQIKANSSSCVDCHGDDSYKETYNEWQKEIIDKLEKIDTWFLANRKLKPNLQEKKQIMWVKNAVLKIKADGSKGIHNFNSTQSLVDKCLEILNEIN